MICQGWLYCLGLLLMTAWFAGCRSGQPNHTMRTSAVEIQPGSDGMVGLEPRASVDTPRASVDTDEAVRLASHLSPGKPTGDRSSEPEVFSPTELSGTGFPQTRRQGMGDDLPLPNIVGSEPVGSDSAEPELLAAPAAIQLRDVIVSVQSAYPLLMSAIQERTVASGKQLAARGEFDLRAKAFGVAAPEGFYQNYRNGLSLDQPLFRGGYVYGGYKIGDGLFQPWFKERETDEGGEFSVGFGTPLLKGRSIDQRRADLFQADLARQAVEPAVRAQMLEFVRIASLSYWNWVAAGQELLAQRELLENAQDRVEQIEQRVDAGDLPRIADINNKQLIAARETKVIESDRKLQKAAIKLSLFYRNARGEPLVPANSQLPLAFPRHVAPNSDAMAEDIDLAIEASPELAELELIAEQVRVELRKAQNMMLPKLDARALASKDVGAPASAKRDKTPFELEAGLYGELPLQRRAARGKIGAAEGKLAQINAKRQYVLDKIVAAVQDATSALEAAAGRIDQSQTNVRLARETLALGRLQFDAGDIDLVELNIYEKSVTDAQLLLISAEADFFGALANYRAALSADPQALSAPR